MGLEQVGNQVRPVLAAGYKIVPFFGHDPEHLLLDFYSPRGKIILLGGDHFANRIGLHFEGFVGSENLDIKPVSQQVLDHILMLGRNDVS